ncbi:MAG: hypothetical protein ACYCSJ_08835 [Acidimicrobiales bacterium]
MLDVHFVLLGAAVATVGTGFYLRDTLRGVTQPNRVTWLLWSAAPLLAFAVEVREGVGLRSLMTFVVGFSPLLVFLASFHNRASYWRIGWLDYLCGVVSVAGLAVWLATRHGTVAIIASIAADALAAAPTLLKSWKEPDTETAAVYFGSTANAVITLLTIHTWTTAVDAFPLYIAFISTVEIVLVAGRLGPRLVSARPGARSPSRTRPGCDPRCPRPGA